MNLMEIGIVGLIVICVLALFSSAYQDSKHKEIFMSECTKYHKQFECDVYWGQAKVKNGGDMPTGLAIGLAAGMAGRR